ncbi:Bug family tripartite tricarboxylate transporter substrate binding protein [Alicycliphilus denitrificans]|uniref:Bug family tripartite tricarboxylate transporter substrate binding protein n=1 Tax=Alicycliphilus denitrificans TaxID=179636 RepID=UPI003A8087BE
MFGKKGWLWGGVAMALGAWMLPAAAQVNRPITIVVGATPGGSTDTLARVIAQSMGTTLKRTVIVENKPGAGGNIAAQYVAKSAPDGSTLLMSFTSHTINATLFKNLPFNPVADFTPITMVAQVPSVLVARKNAPFDDVKGLIDYARKHPNKLTFAIGGQGSSLHLASEQFKFATQTDIVNIPYKGTGPALSDLLASDTVDLMFASTINVLPHYKQGTLKFLGVSSLQPLPQFAGLPAIASVVPGYRSEAWFGLFGPAKLPREVTDTLYAAVRQAIDAPAYRQRMESEAATVPTMTPAQFADFIKKDVQFWGDIVKKSGATVE